MNDQLVAPNLKQKGLKALDRQMLSYIVPPIMFPVHGFPGFCAPKMRYAETLKEPMLEAKREAVLPRELRRIRASALTGDKKYGSVMDVLQIVYGQDFCEILKDYVDTHQEELYKNGIMPDSLFTRLGGIGKPYIETNYDQPSKAFFLDVVVDCLLDGEHYQRCVSFYIRYKMSFCAMDPRCFLWEIGLYRSDVDDELRDTNRTKADGNLLPKITAAKYDEIVDDLLESYNPEALDAPGPVDVYKIADGIHKLFTFQIAFKGSPGAAGSSSQWYTGTKITGTSTTATIFSDSGITEAKVGDMYLDTSTQNTYRCTVAGAASVAKWVYVSNIKGATGGAGSSAQWYTGTGITGTSTTATIFSGSGVTNAKVGDMYLNTSTQNTYRCTVAGAADVAKWVYVSNIKGATGGAGPAGADAITMSITSSNGTIFKNTGVSTTLTAHVYKAGVELNATQIAALGIIKWYKDGSSTAMSTTGPTLNITPSDVTNKASYIAQLEG